MTLKSWKDVARDVQARTSAQPPGAPAAPAPGPAALLDVAATNPDLKRLLQERERLERKMNEIVAGSQGNFAGRHDNVRFPVEPLGERRARDARWADARDETRSAAVRRILEARRQQISAVDGPHPDWTDQRERQLYEAQKQAQSLRSEKAEQIRALDARIERAREELRREAAIEDQPDRGPDWPASRERQLTDALDRARRQIVDRVEQEHALDRRAGRAPENQLANRAASMPEQREDWQAARERQRTDALERARTQIVDRDEQEHALDRRLELARENQLAKRAGSTPEQSEDWQATRERQVARALDKARTPVVQDVTQEQAPDRRFEPDRETPRETTRAAPEPEQSADRPTGLDRRRSGAQDQPRAPAPDASNPQQALDQRLARAREQVLEENRAARKREREQEVSALREQPRDRADALDRRQQRVRDRLERANQTARKIERVTDSASGKAARGVDGLRQLDKSLQQFDEARDDGGAGENIEELGKLRSGLGKAVSLADKAEAPLRRAQDRQQTWQAKRESAREKLRQFKTVQDSNRRKLGVDAGSIDQLTALRDKARELWSDDRDKKKDAEKKQKTLAERAKDLDERRKQALERLTARREGNRRDEQRQQRGLSRLKSGGDDFRG
jgi:hypothetical protein